MHLNDLSGLLTFEVDQLKKMETKLIDALTEMKEGATNPELRKAFSEHLSETREQLSRLESINSIPMESLAGEEMPEDESAVDALIDDATAILEHEGVTTIKDTALIAAAQKAEHYEMACYGCAKAHAKALGLNDVADILDKNMKEEENADKKLSGIAEGSWFKEGLNEKAENVDSEMLDE